MIFAPLHAPFDIVASCRPFVEMCLRMERYRPQGWEGLGIHTVAVVVVVPDIVLEEARSSAVLVVGD